MRKIQSHDLEAATNVRKVRHEVDSDVPRGCDWPILVLRSLYHRLLRVHHNQAIVAHLM